MNRARKMDGYTRIDDHGGKGMPLHIVYSDGLPHLMVHVEGLTTGLIQRDGELTPNITLWNGPSGGRPIGMAMTFIPNDDMLDTIIASLTSLRDERRAAANKLASAALRKAAGK